MKKIKVMKPKADMILKICRFCRTLLVFLIAVEIGVSFLPKTAYASAGNLEIHYINVGQGSAVLIIGPNNTRILYDFGWLDGNKSIVPYLTKTVGLKPEDGIHYSIVSHNDSDHYTGYKGVIDSGFDIIVANYGAGSPKPETPTIQRQWLIPAIRTTGGAVRPIPVGLRISLGNGAEAVVMAANGKIYGKKEKISVSNENDRSVAIFIHYGKFQFILDGDMGSGPEDCTKHVTSQRNIQEPVAEGLINVGLLNPEFGVDVNACSPSWERKLNFSGILQYYEAAARYY